MPLPVQWRASVVFFLAACAALWAWRHRRRVVFEVLTGLRDLLEPVLACVLLPEYLVDRRLLRADVPPTARHVSYGTPMHAALRLIERLRTWVGTGKPPVTTRLVYFWGFVVAAFPLAVWGQQHGTDPGTADVARDWVQSWLRLEDRILGR